MLRNLRQDAVPEVSARRLLAVAVLLATVGSGAASCSLANRRGPDTTCAALSDGKINDCGEGILASCVSGAVEYEVCDDKNVCEADWQLPGQYRCVDTDPVRVPTNLVLQQQPCGLCVSAKCQPADLACYGDSMCTAFRSCVSACPYDPAKQAPCVAACFSTYKSGALYRWAACVIKGCATVCEG